MPLSSLHSLGGPSPLRITEDLLRQLLQRYNVDSEFWHVLLSFGKSPLPSECGSNNLFCQVDRATSTGRLALCLALYVDSLAYRENGI